MVQGGDARLIVRIKTVPNRQM